VIFASGSCGCVQSMPASRAAFVAIAIGDTSSTRNRSCRSR
jgi:hypothetical protein